MDAPERIISDEEVIRVHGFANFGSMSPREVLADGVRKYAIGYSGGNTQLCILLEHGLITKPKPGEYGANLTVKGKRYARAVSESLRTALDSATARAEAAEARLRKMHRRAQKAEGLSQRSADLLETVMRSIKDVLPLLPTLPSPYPLSLHNLFHRVLAARNHARASSGRAYTEKRHYYRGLTDAERKRAEAAEAAAKTAREAEREACAKVAETLHETSWPDTIAAAIRAREATP